MGINWTDDIIERLKEHKDNGLAASESSAKLSAEFGIDFTRNMVIAKRHRLGLTCGVDEMRHNSRRAALKRHKQARVQTGAPEPTRVRKPSSFTVTSNKTGLFVLGENIAKEPLPKPEMPEDFPDRVTMKALTKTSCRWPIGDPQHEDFGFCGVTAVPGLPYCEPHARRAYQPTQSKQRAPVANNYPIVQAMKEPVDA